MKDINWSWVAGFFQAEGTPTGHRNGWKTQSYQQDVESLQLLQSFFLDNLTDHHSAIYSDTEANRYGRTKTVARLNINLKGVTV